MAAPPIFIVGCPRSGTTLLRRMLNRHPGLAIFGETQFHLLVYLRRNAFGDLRDPAKRERLIREYLQSRPLKAAGLNIAELAEKLSREATSYQALFTSMLSYYADSQGKPRYGEKTALHALFLETLREWFPGALILHLLRDPRAVVASLQHAPWAPDSVVINARKWLKLNRAARLFRDQPGYLEVRYEALVTDPVHELRTICAFLREEYSPAMMVPEQHSATDGERRSMTAVTPARLDVWKKELTADQVTQIEWVLASEMESFGYQRSTSSAAALTVLRGVSDAARDLAGHVITRLPPFLWYRFAAPTRMEKSDYRWGLKSMPKNHGIISGRPPRPAASRRSFPQN
jgi:hypothetical protein